MTLEAPLQPGEYVIETVRKHPLILLAQLLPFIFLDYLPYLAPKIAILSESTNPQAAALWMSIFTFANPWFTFFVGIYWLFIWMAMFGVFINYYLDQWVITNKRLIDINQKGFFDRDVAILLMVRVENVQTDLTGVLNTLFGFGTVNVETAGASIDRFAMSGLSNANRIRDLLMKTSAECRLHEKEMIDKEP